MSGGPIEISSKLCVLAIIVKLKAELIIDNPALLNCLVVAAKSEETFVIEGIILLLTYLLIHYQVHQLPNQVVSVIKKVVGIKSQPMLIKLANAISWSQNENDAANTQLLPMIIQGAGHGTMSVKNAYETCLVVCTRIRNHEYGIDPLISSLTGKEKLACRFLSNRWQAASSCNDIPNYHQSRLYPDFRVILWFMKKK